MKDQIRNFLGQIWVRRRCPHARQRCVHGDEIIQRGFARAACLDCGRSLKRDPLPDICYFTGDIHPSLRGSHSGIEVTE